MGKPSIFLSYARGDDEPFVWRIYNDLTARGFDVWFDRIHLPSRQLTFHQEIKDAIRTRDRLLYVAGPGAATSDYVREEWLFALEIDKPVIPILRVGDYDFVPGSLSFMHCDDFRDDAHYPTQLQKLITNLGRPVPPLGKLFAVPELPRVFLDRPELIRQLKDALMIDLQKPVVVTGAASRVGVQGMAGIGKSLLAVAIARDPEIRRAYPDGVIWLRFGPEPNLVQVQRLIVKALGGEPTFQNDTEGSGVLRELLRDRAALLVLDDVWQARHAMDVAELGPRTRALITTRDAGILNTLHGAQFQVQLLTEAESLQLLADTIGSDTSSLPSDAREVVNECGRLPLALALCASMACGEHGVPWSTILDALREAHLEEICDDHALNEQHRSVWRAIKVSVDSLRPDQRQRWVELSVFAPDKAVPDTAVRIFWGHTGGLGQIQCEKLLKRLWERSLIYLDRDPADQSASVPRRVSMHDLLYDYSSRIAGERKGLHGRFAAAAWSVYVERPDEFDGYVRDHLPKHLVGADEPLRLLDLLADSQLDYFHRWAEQGMAAEGATCLEFLVDDLQKRSGQENLIRSLATQLGRLHNRLGNDTSAEHWLNVALTGYHAGGKAGRAEAVGLHELASLALSRGEYSQAAKVFRQALRLSRTLSPPLASEIAGNLIGLAIVTYLADLRTARTIRLARLALDWAEHAHDGAHMAEACRILADVFKDEMRYPEAWHYLERGLAIAERENLSAARLSLLTARAWMLYHRAVLGDQTPAAAEGAFRELLQQAVLIQDWRFEGDAWSGVGCVALLGGRGPLLDEAIARLTTLCRGQTRPHLEARLRLLEAARLHRSQRFAESARLYEETAEFSGQAGLWSRQADALISQGVALFHDGRTHDAERCWRRAEAVLSCCPRVRQVIAARCLESCRRLVPGLPLPPL
jgi:tetratricopeptide (TPR) repeat protein